jgi:hypothetical protein
MTRLAGHGRPDDLPVAIEPPAGSWSTDYWPPGTPWSRSTPTASTPPDPAGERPRPSPTPVTASSWPTTCAPMATGCAACNPPMLPPVTCRPSRACARTTGGQDHCHQPAQRPASGPLARRQGHLCPPGQRHRAGLPGALSHSAGRPAAGRGPPSRLPAPPRLQRPAHPSRAASPAAGRPGRRRPAQSRGPGRLHPHPGPAAAQPTWQPRRTGSSPGRRPGQASQDHGPPAAASHRPDQPGPGPGRGRPDPGPGQ